MRNQGFTSFRRKPNLARSPLCDCRGYLAGGVHLIAMPDKSCIPRFGRRQRAINDVAGHPGGLLGFGRSDLAVQAVPNAITSY
jgi:hypothetical protein